MTVKLYFSSKGVKWDLLKCQKGPVVANWVEARHLCQMRPSRATHDLRYDFCMCTKSTVRLVLNFLRSNLSHRYLRRAVFVITPLRLQVEHMNEGLFFPFFVVTSSILACKRKVVNKGR